MIMSKMIIQIFLFIFQPTNDCQNSSITKINRDEQNNSGFNYNVVVASNRFSLLSASADWVKAALGDVHSHWINHYETINPIQFLYTNITHGLYADTIIKSFENFSIC